MPSTLEDLVLGSMKMDTNTRFVRATTFIQHYPTWWDIIRSLVCIK